MMFKKAFSRSSGDKSKSIKMARPVPTFVPGRESSSSGMASTPTTDPTRFGMCSLHGRKQEDRIIFGEKVFPDVYLYAVIDGHGGPDTADYLKEALPRVVSMICRERYTHLTSMEENPEHFQSILKLAFKVCADEWDGGVHTASRKIAGAVATVVLVQGQTCVIAHVGDCRVVAATATASAELTEEHRATMPSEKARIEQKGGRVISGRVNGLLSPSRAFGDLHVRTSQDGSILDCITPEPDLSFFQVDLEGFLIISSDGVNDVIPSHMAANLVRESLKRNKDASVAAKELASCAQSMNDDDVSVVVLTWQ